MSDNEGPILVARGRIPHGVVGPALFIAFALPTVTIVLLFQMFRGAEHAGAFAPTQLGRFISWLIGTNASGAGLRLMGLGFALATPGLLSGILVARFVAHRSGEVALFANGIAWLAPHPSSKPVAVPWERFEGFRDTPHPWVEVLERNGRCRTIPTPTEPERDCVLEVLSRHGLVDLALPPDERPRRA